MATNFKSSIINSGLNFKSSTQNSSLGYKRFKNTNLFNKKKYLFGDGVYSQNIIQLAIANNLSSDSNATHFASDYIGSYGPYMAFNGTQKDQNQYGWQDNNSGNIIGKYLGRYFSGSSKLITTIRIWNGQYYSGWRANAKDIVVEGSNDCVTNGSGVLSTVGTWTKIPVIAITGGTIINGDEARLDAEAGTGVTPTNTLTLGGTTLYKAIRIRFTSAPWTQTFVQIREMEIDEIIQPVASYQPPDIMPTATANITGNWTFSANSEYSGTPAYAAANDTIPGTTGTNYTTWNSGGGGPCWWQAAKNDGIPETISAYKIYSNSGGPLRTPTTFQLWGSNTGAFSGEHTILDSQTGLTWTAGQSRTFTLSSPATFIYFRIYMTAYGSGGDGYYNLGEVEFLPPTMTNCIVITGNGTVVPDSVTGVSLYTAENICVTGGTFCPSTNSKGFIGLVKNSFRLSAGGKAHIDKLGKAGNFGNLTIFDLVPQNIKKRLKLALSNYIIQGEGAAGALGVGPSAGVSGNTGASAGNGTMKTGGGGSGAIWANSASYTTGKGGKGGPCCGGAGSGGCWSSGPPYTGVDAGDYGGPGGQGLSNSAAAPGGAGDPVGAGVYGGNPGQGAGGGLFILLTSTLYVTSGCTISSNGASGGIAPVNTGGAAGGAGGGCVVIITSPAGLYNNGTIQALGGPGLLSGQGGTYGGSGGDGSVNIFTIG